MSRVVDRVISRLTAPLQRHPLAAAYLRQFLYAIQFEYQHLNISSNPKK